MKKIKYIISVVIMAIIFAMFTLSASADPLTGAMMGAAAASGFGFPGFVGATPGSTGSLTDIGYTDPVAWDSISHKSATVTDVDENTVSVNLSSDISTAGYNRLRQFNTNYGMSPGSIVNLGTYYSYNGYAFNRQFTRDNYVWYKGVGLGKMPGSFMETSTVSFAACTIEISRNGNTDEFKVHSRIGNSGIKYSTAGSTVFNSSLSLCFSPGLNSVGWVYTNGTTIKGSATSSESGITVSQNTYQVTRSEDSEIVNPDGLENKIIMPKMYVNNITYVSGEEITDLDELVKLMEQITEAVTNDDAESEYDNPTLPPPGPTDPPTDPPADIPGYIGDIQQGIDNIVDSQGGILEGVEGIQETLEGVEEGVGDIAEALEGVGEGIGSITDALDVPTTSEATQLKLPDLRTLFPFCIPFDIYNIITAFNASPVAPHIQIPFNIPAIGLMYTFDLDFSAYNSVAAVLRTLEFVAYAVGLAILTSKVIRW